MRTKREGGEGRGGNKEISIANWPVYVPYKLLISKEEKLTNNYLNKVHLNINCRALIG